MKKLDNTISNDAFEFFFNSIGYFNHYAFFTKKLWKNNNMYKDEDEAEVKCAFLSWWVYSMLNIRTKPVGSAWSWKDCPEDSFNTYIEHWMDLFNDFTNWQISQR